MPASVPYYGATDAGGDPDDKPAQVVGRVTNSGDGQFGDAPIVAFGVPVYPDSPEPAATRFTTRGWNDVWAAVAFLASAAGVIFLLPPMMVGAPSAAVRTSPAARPRLHADVAPDDGASGPTARRTVDITAGVAIACTVVLCTVALHAMRRTPAGYIRGTFFAMGVANLAIALSLAMAGQLLGAVFAFVFALYILMVVRLLPAMMDFSVVVLRAAADLALARTGVWLTAAAAVVAGLGYTTAWSRATAPLFLQLQAFAVEQEAGAAPPGGLAAACAFSLFCLFWVYQVCLGVVHVVASGVTAAWFFIGAGRLPPRPSVPIVKRALTTSLGSICLGALLVATTEALYWSVRTQLENSNEVVRCIAVCLADLLAALVERFNNYGLVHVAIYGAPYVEASKLTWELIYNFFWDAYLNDCLIWPCVQMTTVGVAAVSGGIAWLVTMDPAAAGAAAITALVTASVLLRPVYASAISQFVCMAESSSAAALAAAASTRNPEYAHELQFAAGEDAPVTEGAGRV